MTLKTRLQTLTLTDGLVVRYRPLPCLEVADYIETHGERLRAGGSFDTLMYNGAGLSVGGDRPTDLATVAVLGRAFVELLSGPVAVDSKDAATPATASPKRLRALGIEHCELFKVEVEQTAGAGDWLALHGANALDNINACLDIGQLTEIVGKLGWEAMRPLWNRLTSFAEARRNESQQPSPSDSPTS